MVVRAPDGSFAAVEGSLYVDLEGERREISMLQKLDSASGMEASGRSGVHGACSLAGRSSTALRVILGRVGACVCVPLVV